MANSSHTAFNTHDRLIAHLTPNRLNELYFRVDNLEIQNEINKQLHKINKDLNCNTNIDDICDIFINFTDSNKNQIAHISLHIQSENKHMTNIKRKHGRFHAHNNKISGNKGYIPFIINSKQTPLFISYIEPNTMNSDFKICLDTSLNILNKYFKGNDKQLHLRYYKQKYPYVAHRCSSYTIKKINSSAKSFKKRLQHTRKSYHY